MFRRFIFLAALLALAMCAVAPAVMSSSAGEKPSPSLAEQVQKLQETIKKVEARVATLEKRQTYVVLPSQSPALRPPIQPLPKGWEPREFDGVRYYLAPVGNNKR